LRIAILSDNISGAAKIFKEVRVIPNCYVDICLCNNYKKPILSYLIMQVIRFFLRVSPGLWFLLFCNIFSGHLKIFFNGLASPKAKDQIKKLNYEIGLHNTNIIYNADIIGCFSRGILNAHIALLPRYRGRCVMEWSLYEGSLTGMTVFYIDEGIDTGSEIVIREQVSIHDCASIRSAKNKLFGLAGYYFAKAIRSEIEGQPHMINDGSGPRYYVMSKKLLSEVEKKYFKDVS
jgi:hypothetical protein